MNLFAEQSIKKILIVDDDPVDRLFVKRNLPKECLCLEAEDGQEAVNIARTEKPDLILMDVMMPNMDGYTSCQMLKAHTITKMIPVVMLTGLDSELNVKLSEALGTVGYINKPFQLKELLDVLSKYSLGNK
jgi:CheY-like chemotaxis protein